MIYLCVARRGAHLAAERSPSVARADGARRSVAVPNGEGVASGSATKKLIINALFVKSAKLQENKT